MENLPVSPLTPKEIEFLGLAAQGLTNSEISEAIDCSLSTVHKHLESARTKFRARNMVQLVAMAITKELIEYKHTQRALR
ncbi:hypothetical protein GZ77_26390 [Endozoicomonas montiporae]|uniref:HTH luxR-type domain-containing protein n=1 Tax=Endozoicomonas montiporae TaxID=1027273 RepID=A0A081MYG0_9GAMM|nr:hypothetical protein GZ77_26390 [Endozoicomonas montiporae]